MMAPTVQVSTLLVPNKTMTTSGWIDTFRDRGPVLFDGLNRTPAIEDVRNVLIYITFLTLFIAFLIIFPGIRKERISTFICVTVSLLVGAIILVANFGTNWHVAEANISSPYKAFSKEKIFANLGICVGLQSVNITLRTRPHHLGYYDKHQDINYNERFYWIDPLEMKNEHKKALAKGLPFPILTIAEYLSQDGEGFCWGRRYRLAGYYASLLLWASFCSWILMNVLLCAVPRYGVYCMQLTGMLMMSTNALYSILLPKKALNIPFESDVMHFTFGWSFWIVLYGGILAVMVGALVTILDSLFPNKFSTILEIDYDTPYRYFVGNDAHLFGHHSSIECPHVTGSTSDIGSHDDNCCGHSHSHKVPVKKMKSDASTSTNVSYPVKKLNIIGERPSTSTMSTSTEICEVSSSSDCKEMIEPQLSSSSSNNNNHVRDSDTEEKEGFENDAFEGDEQLDSDASSEVSTTYIDGKRAVTLSNFGKFTQQEQKRKDSKPTEVHVQRRMNVSSGQSKPETVSTSTSTSVSPSTPSTSSSSNARTRPTQTHIDLTASSAALW